MTVIGPTTSAQVSPVCYGGPLASIDGNVARAERDFFTGLSKRLDVKPARAAEIQRAVAERVG
jgi:hypothetical protein